MSPISPIRDPHRHNHVRFGGCRVLFNDVQRLNISDKDVRSSVQITSILVSQYTDYNFYFKTLKKNKSSLFLNT